MIEIMNENKAMAVKVWNESNAEVRGYLLEIIAAEAPVEMLKAIAMDIHEKALMERTPNGEIR